MKPGPEPFIGIGMFGGGSGGGKRGDPPPPLNGGLGTSPKSDIFACYP